MTQEYLEQVFAAYDGLEQVAITSDGTAFLTTQHALAHAEKLPDAKVVLVNKGQQLEDAVEYVPGVPVATTADTVNEAATTEAATDANVPIDELSMADLKAMAESLGLDTKGAKSKKAVIEIINASIAAKEAEEAAAAAKATTEGEAATDAQTEDAAAKATTEGEAATDAQTEGK